MFGFVGSWERCVAVVPLLHSLGPRILRAIKASQWLISRDCDARRSIWLLEAGGLGRLMAYGL